MIKTEEEEGKEEKGDLKEDDREEEKDRKLATISPSQK